MERGANTFPFHNLLHYSESNEGLFLFFAPSLNWIKEKSVATLAIRYIGDQTQNNRKSVLPTYYNVFRDNRLCLWFFWAVKSKFSLVLDPPLPCKGSVWHV